jgi:hypothetical protein
MCLRYYGMIPAIKKSVGVFPVALVERETGRSPVVALESME